MVTVAMTLSYKMGINSVECTVDSVRKPGEIHMNKLKPFCFSVLRFPGHLAILYGSVPTDLSVFRDILF